MGIKEDTWRQLEFSLQHRITPTVYFISTQTEWQRTRLFEKVKSAAPQYKHEILDLGNTHVYSLRDALDNHLPEQVRSSSLLQYMVHVKGLSGSLFEHRDGELKPSRLPEEMNFEREVLFHNYPFILIIWENEYFFNQLFHRAPDLASWIVDYYEFRETKSTLVQEEPIPYKERIETKGVLPERLERIAKLEELVTRLDEKNNSPEQRMREQLNAYTILGQECDEALQWEKAENYLLKAEKLAVKLFPGLTQEAYLFHLLGDHYRITRNNTMSLKYFKRSLQDYERNNDEKSYGGLYHNMGMVYQQQRNWKEAIEHYQKALVFYQKTGNEFELGGTYHQLGIVYEEQQSWSMAIEYYQKAIDWKQKTGNEFALGSSYHQLGMVYQLQQNWGLAIEHYQKALEWKQKTGNEFALGSTYHQLGRVYEGQRNWNMAIEHYQKAINWNQKTGNEFILGVTYHQLGRIYEEQKDYAAAYTWFEKAIENLRGNNHPYLEIAEASLQRARKEIKTATGK